MSEDPVPYNVRGGKKVHSKTLGERLFNLRSQRGISLRALARNLDVSPGHLSHVETGKAPISQELIFKIAKFFGTNPDPLLCLAGHVPADVAALIVQFPNICNYVRKTWGNK